AIRTTPLVVASKSPKRARCRRCGVPSSRMSAFIINLVSMWRAYSLRRRTGIIRCCAVFGGLWVCSASLGCRAQLGLKVAVPLEHHDVRCLLARVLFCQPRMLARQAQCTSGCQFVGLGLGVGNVGLKSLCW